MSFARHLLLILGLTTGGCFEFEVADPGPGGGFDFGDDEPEPRPGPRVLCDQCVGPRAVGELLTLETRFHATCDSFLGSSDCNYQDYTLRVWCDDNVGVACEVTGPDQGEGTGTLTDVRPLEAGEARIWVLMNIVDYVQIPPFDIMTADGIDMYCYAGTPAVPCVGDVLEAPVLLDFPLMAGEQRLLTEPTVTATQPMEWVLLDGASLDAGRYAPGQNAHVVRLRNFEGPVSVTAEYDGLVVTVDLEVQAPPAAGAL